MAGKYQKMCVHTIVALIGLDVVLRRGGHRKVTAYSTSGWNDFKTPPLTWMGIQGIAIHPFKKRPLIALSLAQAVFVYIENMWQKQWIGKSSFDL